MLPSVNAFFSQIIDYAGMFPPAKLPLEEALRNYLRYRKESPHRWMLGRFVCPTARLQDFLALARTSQHSGLLSLTALGQQASQASEFGPQILADVQAIEDFRRGWGNDAVIDTYEVALPKGAAVQSLATEMQLVESRLKRAKLRWFIEIPLTGSRTFDEDQLAEISANRQVGLKLRTGGLTTDAFPSDDQVAFFIDRCRSARLPWKATAGLHHPRRHWDASLQFWHHGFLNVFGAGLLALAHPLNVNDMAEILSDREAQHFRFDADGFAWKDWTCPTAQIVELRSTAATSFGSCSFDEPCQDLLAMGLIEASRAP